MTTAGGKYFDRINFISGGGVIFKTNKIGKNYQVVYNFDSATGIEPYGSLIQATNGKLYGITGSVSSTMFTCLFEFDPITRMYKVLMKADTLRGGRSYRRGAPFQANNGKLYSLASNTLVETDLNTGINTVIADGISTASGENYFMQASNGKVYFVTTNTNFLVGQRGGLFELDIAGKTLVLRHQFFDQTGTGSYGSLVEWAPDVLYGTFASGTGNDSTIDGGGIFRYDLITGLYEIKSLFYNLGIKRNSIAFGGLTRFGNKLYGATLYGGNNDFGFIYSYDPVTNSLDTLINFATVNWSTFPYDSLRQEYYYNQFGWGTDLLASYDNKLYALTGGSMFSYNPVDSHFQSLNSLSAGSTQFSGSLGFSVNNGRLIEICTPPYYLSTIPDTIHVFQHQPFSFTISTPNTDTFHWVKDVTTSLPLQTDSILHFDSTHLTDQGWYTCTLVNECGDSTTKRFYLKVDIVTPLGLAFTGKVISHSAGGGQGKAAFLQWTNPTAKDVDTYTLQRSPAVGGGRSFAAINTTKSKPNQQEYSYTDEAFETFTNANNGKAFYRLLQRSKDGKENYSNVVLLTTANSPLTITPNPASDKVIVSFGKLMNGVVKFDLLTANGQIVLSKQAKNITTQTIAMGHLPAGVYTMQITTNEAVENRKLIVEK